MSVITDVHVGNPNDDWCRPLETIEDRVHYLRLYPRGNCRASEGMISVHLGRELTAKIVVHFDVILMNKAADRAGTVCSSPNKIEYLHIHSQTRKGGGRGAGMV
eukprot:scaffold37526_cov59-Cyclotella_meneghiniana.AAC.3